jgi:hypothetical protein
LGYAAGSDFTQPGLNNATAIGAYADVAESNALVLGSISGVNGATASTRVGIGTTAPLYTLDVHGTGNFTGPVNFAAGQTFPGTITSVSPGTGLTSSVIGSNVTLNVDTTKVPQLSAANTFTASQSVNGSITATGTVTSGVVVATSVNATGAVNSGVVNATTGFDIGGTPFAFGSYGNQNAFLGFAGNSIMTGAYNTASGYQALNSNTTGNLNTANGVGALASNTVGTQNTANGNYALGSNTTGSQNTASGVGTLSTNTTGVDNTATGLTALRYNTTGYNNTASGVGALQSNTKEQTTTWDRTVVDRSAELNSWVDFCYQVRKRGVLIYAFANNHFSGHAPGTIEQFRSIWQEKGFPPLNTPRPSNRQPSLFST